MILRDFLRGRAMSLGSNRKDKNKNKNKKSIIEILHEESCQSMVAVSPPPPASADSGGVLYCSDVLY